MNLVLDTNAFYYYFGRDKLALSADPKVNLTRLKTILNNPGNTVSISSVTIIEFLVRYREKPDLIKEILRFLVLKRINIIYMGIAEFSIETIPEFLKASDAIVKSKVEYYLKKKIKTESGFATTMLLLLLKIYINFYLEREERDNEQFKSLPDKERDKRKSEVFSLLLSDEIQQYLIKCNSIFTKVLRKGYAEGKEEKRIKDAFNNILYLNCAIFSCFIEFYINNYDTMEFTDEQLKEEYIKIANTNSDFNIIEKTPDHISKGIKQIIDEFDKETSSGFIEKHRQDIIDNWKKGDMFSARQAEYIGCLFVKWYQRGSKYEKNDMLDMMILRTLDIENWVLLTFDKSMMKYISEIGHHSTKYINRLYN